MHTWIGATLEWKRSIGSRLLLHQRRGADARHASPDPPQVRAAWPRAADAHDWQHAPVLPGRTRAVEGDQTPGRRRRNQPRRRAALAVDCGDSPADPTPDARRCAVDT